ncbi:MAG TPA: T9SS type A sorting domain-containing protein [Bacteroidota bacterium]|nr:T9SS type A sorting domain-containing protein [Bacteroidota bacterium]
MKSLTIIALILALLAPGALGQPLYRVPADSRGNTLVLTVANESQTTTANAVTVKLAGSHPGLNLSPSSVTVKSLAATNSADVSFSFDVDREAKLNQPDTLDFELRDKAGERWTKTIILEYTGPQEFRLDQNYPNPFNPTTVIRFQTPGVSRVQIVVYNILGQEVAKLVDETKEAGYYSAIFNAGKLASGAYIYRMIAQPVAGGKAYVAVKKLTAIK